uniref:Putative ovule protein n=1 Tax=Solanum chacoense TaxID=4108 RepID=A0A0V0GVE4_SOLCH
MGDMLLFLQFTFKPETPSKTTSITLMYWRSVTSSSPSFNLKLLNQLFWKIVLTMLLRPSIAIMNRKGNSGSPCILPLSEGKTKQIEWKTSTLFLRSGSRGMNYLGN